MKEENKVLKNRFRKSLEKISIIFLWFFGGLYLIILSLGWMNSDGIISPNSLLSGFDYIPPLGIFILLMPALLMAFITKKWKISTAFFSLFLVFWLFHGDHSLIKQSKPNKFPIKENNKVSVVSLNVAQFYTGINKLGNKIEKIKPDVICFQELENYDKIGLKDIKKAFPSYSVALGKNTDNAILSIHPIIEFNEVKLPSKQPLYEKNTQEKLINQPHRYFLHAVIDKDGKKINILNLRLIAGRGMNLNESVKEVVRWGRYLMLQQHNEAKIMASYISKLQGPCIYMGDLNASPNSRAIKPFYKLGIDTALSRHIIPPTSFPADFAYQRLDYIFCTKDLIPIKAEVLPWQISDHRPILAIMAYNKTKNNNKELKVGSKKCQILK